MGEGTLVREKMRAALLYGVKDLRVEDVDVPEAGPGEALVRVRAATTCGTDLKIFRRGYIGGVIEYPTIFGHEWAGDVVEVGGGVSAIREGMRVRGGNSGPCLRCRMCMKGMYNLCENMTWLWGAYAEYIRVPAPITTINTQEIPSHLTYEEAAVTEPLACCLHGIGRCGIQVGDKVAVIGEGPIGLLHLQLARAMGAGRVIVCGLVEGRLMVAEELGADVTVNAGEEDSVGAVRRLTEGCGVDVVIEAVGLPSTWEQALMMLGKGGRALMFGGCPPGTEVRMETEGLHYGERTVLGAFHATPADFTKALGLISSGVVRVKPLVTRRMGIEEIGEAFELLSTTKDDLKIAILP